MQTKLAIELTMSMCICATARTRFHSNCRQRRRAEIARRSQIAYGYSVSLSCGATLDFAEGACPHIYSRFGAIVEVGLP